MAPLRSRAKQSKPKPKKEVTNIDDDDSEDSKAGCVYISHIPHGFYEEQMEGYFSQFGQVLAVRVCRSKKTGGCKGYGFVKFKYAAVAKIVAETCNNYLIFNKLLQCQYKPLSEIHKNTFLNIPWRPRKTPIRQFNSLKSEGQMQKSMKKSISKAQKKMNSLKEMGLDVDLHEIMDVPEEIKLNVVAPASAQKSSEKKSESDPAEPANKKRKVEPANKKGKVEPANKKGKVEPANKKREVEPANKKRKVVMSNSPSLDSQLPKISPRRLRSTKVDEKTTKALKPATAKSPVKKTQLKEKSPVKSPNVTRPQRKIRKIVK